MNFAKTKSKEIFLKFANSYENAMVASYKSKFITEILTIIFIFLSIVFIFISGKRYRKSNSFIVSIYKNDSKSI